MGLIIKSLLISLFLGIFCTTKVSEWVLLNKIPEDYLLVCHAGSETGSNINAANIGLRSKMSNANIRFREVKNENTQKPYYSLYYKNRLIRNYNDIGGLANLTFSPLRAKIAGEIMEGKLCIMLFLTCGNETKDKKYSEIIRKSIGNSPFESVITYVDLDRKSLEEAHFVSMLLHVEEDLMGINEPMLFGIFGRFRALEPLVAGGISEENIGYMINFLTADCSCLIKDDLPGSDILFYNNWENPAPALVNKILDENPALQHL